MTGNWKEFNKPKHLFRSYYCSSCNQRKVCGKLNPEICCSCVYQMEQAKAQAHNSYEEVLANQYIERERRFRQLQLLSSYRGCKECGSLAVDAYFLYEENRLVCQPCRMRKEGGSSHPINFTEQQKWYKRYWRISISE